MRKNRKEKVPIQKSGKVGLKKKRAKEFGGEVASATGGKERWARTEILQITGLKKG